MESVGSYLKNERELRSISLEEIADATKINISMLRAIEEWREEELPVHVFLQGFIRCYAVYIGLDPNEALLRYKKHAKEPEKLEPIEHTDTDIAEKKQKRRLRYDKKNVWILLSSIGLVFSLGLVFYVISKPALPGKQQIGKGIPQKNQTTVRSTALPGAVSNRAKIAATQQETFARQIENKAMQRQAEVRGPHILQGVVKGNTWIQATIDEQSPREYFFKRGDTFVWKVNNKIKLRVGNAGGVEFSFDGKALKPLGKSGQAISLALPDSAPM